MAHIDLTDEERHRLSDVLQKHLTQLSWEIAFTHSRDSGDLLRKNRDFLEGFVQRLNK